MTRNETSVRIGEETFKQIKYEVVAESDDYRSIKNFAEQSIVNNYDSIADKVVGNHTLRTLIQLLNNLRGLNEDKPELTAEATIKGESISEKQINIDPSDKTLGKLSDIQDNTGLDQSAIIRRCVFRELCQLDESSGSQLDWAERSVRRTWMELENEMILPKTKFHEVMERRFVLLPDHMESIAANDPEFAAFAEQYHDKFYGSDCYEKLVDMGGERAYSNAENLIEEYTDYRFGPSEEAMRLFE